MRFVREVTCRQRSRDRSQAFVRERIEFLLFIELLRNDDRDVISRTCDVASDARKPTFMEYMAAALLGVLTAVVLYYGAQALNLKIIP
jgi:ABC-type maltose transport system permease subunit